LCRCHTNAVNIVFVAYALLVTVLSKEVVASGGSAAHRLKSALGWVFVATAAAEPCVCGGHCGGVVLRGLNALSREISLYVVVIVLLDLEVWCLEMLVGE
jgi:hypothetical protein